MSEGKTAQTIKLAERRVFSIRSSRSTMKACAWSNRPPSISTARAGRGQAPVARRRDALRGRIDAAHHAADAGGILAAPAARRQCRRDDPRPGRDREDQGTARHRPRRKTAHLAGASCPTGSANWSRARCRCRAWCAAWTSRSTAAQAARSIARLALQQSGLRPDQPAAHRFRARLEALLALSGIAATRPRWSRRFPHHRDRPGAQAHRLGHRRARSAAACASSPPARYAPTTRLALAVRPVPAA